MGQVAITHIGHDLELRCFSGGGALLGGTANNGQAAADASSPIQGGGVKQ